MRIRLYYDHFGIRVRIEIMSALRKLIATIIDLAIKEDPDHCIDVINGLVDYIKINK